MKSEDIYLFTHSTQKSVLTVIPYLHHWKEEEHVKKYKGRLKFSLLEMGAGSLVEGFSTKHAEFFLSKTEAKHFFHLILEDNIQDTKEYVHRKVNDCQETFLCVFQVKLCDNNRYLLTIKESVYKEDESGTSKVDGKSREARMFIQRETAEKMALECLDYIRHEELIGLQKEEPLHDYIFNYQNPPVEETKEAE